MAAADTARLIASLELKDQFSAGADKAIGKVGKLEGAFAGLGKRAGQGIATAGANLAKLGAVGVLALTGAVKGGIDSLATLEDATSSVDAAIKQMGLSGQVTATQVAQWANQIESDVGAAFDDKDITQAATTLIRYGKVTGDNLQPALRIMTDLAAKTGDVESASTLLAKALADPANAAGKLARAGVVLTDQQQKEIKALADAGDAAGAQALVMKDLETATKGAALASQGPFRRAQSLLKDTIEDVERALAIGFLPVLEKISEKLRGKLADPSFLRKVEDFGRKLADYLGKAVDAAEKLPWSDIGNALKIGGEGAGKILDAFSKAPDWLKTAVLTGWGLNKLTGGAALDFGKGLLGPVFDKFLGRGASPANPMWVQQVGGGAPGTGPGGAGPGLLATGLQFASLVAIAGTVQQALHDFFGIKTGGTLLNPAASQADIQAYNAAHPNTTIGTAGFIAALGGKPLPVTPVTKSGQPMYTGPIGPLQGGGNLPGQLMRSGSTTGFDPKYAAASQLTAMGQIKEHIDSERAENDAAYATMNTNLSSIGQTFAQKLGAAVDELRGLGESGDQLRRDLAKRLGISVSKLVELRHAVTKDLAGKLGLTVGELRAIKRQAGYDDQKIADKLGVSLDVYRQMREAARETASNTLGIKNKDWKPTIVTNVTSNFNVSARTIAKEYQRYVTNAGRQGVQVN